MSGKNALLVLCHSRIPYIAALARLNKECNFYIHVDLKSDIEEIKTDFSLELGNVFWIEKRVSINWGGFSIVQAILNLLEVSLANIENGHFHLLSGNCVFLEDIATIGKKMECYSENTIFLELTNSLRRRYRIRFDTPHADTKIQRNYLGRFLTKFYQYLDKLLPIKSPILMRAPFGNMWFSANRGGMNLLFSLVTEKEIKYFQRKLVPDEHFFQYIILSNNLECFLESNYRYINFIGEANHPELLDLDVLLNLDKGKYWIARKVNNDVALNYLDRLKVVNVK